MTRKNKHFYVSYVTEPNIQVVFYICLNVGCMYSMEGYLKFNKINEPYWLKVVDFEKLAQHILFFLSFWKIETFNTLGPHHFFS